MFGYISFQYWRPYKSNNNQSEQFLAGYCWQIAVKVNLPCLFNLINCPFIHICCQCLVLEIFVCITCRCALHHPLSLSQNLQKVGRPLQTVGGLLQNVKRSLQMDKCPLQMVGCPLQTVRCPLQTVWRQLKTVRRSLQKVGYPLKTVIR